MGCPCKERLAGPRLLLEERLEHVEDVQRNVGMVVLVLAGVVWLLWQRSSGDGD